TPPTSPPSPSPSVPGPGTTCMPRSIAASSCSGATSCVSPVKGSRTNGTVRAFHFLFASDTELRSCDLLQSLHEGQASPLRLSPESTRRLEPVRQHAAPPTGQPFAGHIPAELSIPLLHNAHFEALGGLSGNDPTKR